MRTSKTWNCAMTGATCKSGAAAAIASNDPAEYPQNGYGVEVSTYSCDTGDIRDIAGHLLDTFIQNAVNNGIQSVLVFSDIVLYPEDVHHEIIENCTVDYIVITDLSIGHGELSELCDPQSIRRKMALDACIQEIEKLKENAGKIVFEHPPLMPGQYVLYKNGGRYELGRVKRVTDDGAFVYYSAGDTASKTPWDCIITLENARNIITTDLGGDAAQELFGNGKTGGAR